MAGRSEIQPSRPVLVIEHIAGADRFLVHSTTQKTPEPRIAPSPYAYAVAGRPDSNLMAELQWYLESFLEFPFPPETGRAERVLKALELWGVETLEALLPDFHGGGASGCGLEIVSSDPAVLSWPWEALRSPQTGPVAASCPMVRRVGAAGTPEPRQGGPVSAPMPGDRVNILLIVPRPFGDADVRYRSVARSLVEVIETGSLPAQVDVLRPPTLARLREHLDQHPNHYHILHFDGHGSYAGGAAPEGHLLFERADSTPDPIGAGELYRLLEGRFIAGVVLNACRSAMIGPTAESAFASVAAALLVAGVRSVVAMSYALYVSGAREFLPAFYRTLFETGSMEEAVRAGRNRMRAQPQRVCARGHFALEDWILPVLYQQAPLNLPFVAGAAAKPRESLLPEELRREKDRADTIGRDGPVLALERALRGTPAGILLTGLGGVGKTTLARGFLQWLDSTNGLGRKPWWFDMREVRSAGFIIDRIGEQIFGPGFSGAPLEKRFERLTGALRETGVVIVWDNFESVSGIAGTTVAAGLSEDDRALLRRLLGALNGGATKVLITSRGEESWLDAQSLRLLPLSGLDGEERWEYCELILSGLGLSVDRSNPELLTLMNLLGGHPLATRVILAQLGSRTPGYLATALRTNFAALQLDLRGEAEKQLVSALQILDQTIPEGLRPLLALLSLHEEYVDLDYFETAAKKISDGWTTERIGRLAMILARAGLLRALARNQFEMHPVLTGYLRPAVERDDRWSRAFVDVMGTIASGLVSDLIRRKRPPFFRHVANFYSALREARRLHMNVDDQTMSEALGLWALENGELEEGERLFRHLLTYPKSAAGASQHLGMVAQAKGDFRAAEEWLHKSLEGEEKLGSGGVAATYHQLGVLAEERRDLATARRFYMESLRIKEKLGDDLRTAITYHQLGRTEQKARNFDEARAWYDKALELRRKLGDESGVAIAYHQLGVIAAETNDFATAGPMFRRSLAINGKLGLDAAAAMNYHELGILADQAGDFAGAEKWLRKSLEIKEKVGDLGGAANSYHQLGITAQKAHDFAAAGEWHRKSLEVRKRLGDEYAVAMSWMMLGGLAAERGDFLESGTWSVEALKVFARTNPHAARLTAENFLYAYERASPIDQQKLQELWARARLGRLPV